MAHPLFKLGKKKPKIDKRTFKLAALLKPKVPKAPAEWDFDMDHPAIPTPMFGNDVHGDCVIAGRAHQTLRFEEIEQNAKLAITDTDVLREWHRENGNSEDGLVVLDALNMWRQKGWKACGKKYSIAAFAAIDRKDHSEVKTAIYLLTGAGMGMQVPKSAMQQIQVGKPWDVVAGPSGVPGPNDGHYVYLCGYTKTGPVCVTWGRKQQMTWRFFDRYCDELYAIVDDLDKWRKGPPGIDVSKLQGYLNAL
jgi:hypothetical protein